MRCLFGNLSIAAGPQSRNERSQKKKIMIGLRDGRRDGSLGLVLYVCVRAHVFSAVCCQHGLILKLNTLETAAG